MWVSTTEQIALNLQLKLFHKTSDKKDILHKYINFAKKQKRIGRFSWSQKRFNRKKSTLSLAKPIDKEKRIGLDQKKPASLYWWKRRRKVISYTENYYSRCWKPLTRSFIGNLFCQKIIYGAGTCELPCGLRHKSIQQEEGRCHNQEVHCEHATKIRHFPAMENEVLKQVASVNFTMKNFKELIEVLKNLTFVENCNVQ